MNRRKIILFLTILLSPFVLRAGDNAAAFLNAGVGARALGMGGAFTAVADDVYAPYWNPAGLGLVKAMCFGSMVQTLGSIDHSTLEDITPKYQFLNFIFPLHRVGFYQAGTVGLSMISSTLDKIPYTTLSSDGYVVRQTVKDTEQAYIISYGKNLLGENLSLGGSFKYVQQSISGIPDGSASGYGAEAGAYYRLDKQFSFGIVMQSGIKMQWDNGHTDYGSIRNRVGIAYRPVQTEKMSVLTSCDIIQVQQYPLEGHIGGEVSFSVQEDLEWLHLSNMALRAGIDGIALGDQNNMQGRMNQDLKWTFGIGFGMRILQSAVSLDYALGSTALGDRHRISFSMYY